MNTISVGQSSSRSKTITKKDIELFSKLTGDNQRIHYDSDLAQSLGFVAPLAQGGVITGLFNAIVAHDLPGEGSVFLEVQWKFKKAVLIGDTITASVTVSKIREDKPIVFLDMQVVNQKGDTCVDGSAVVFVHSISQQGDA